MTIKLVKIGEGGAQTVMIHHGEARDEERFAALLAGADRFRQFHRPFSPAGLIERLAGAEPYTEMAQEMERDRSIRLDLTNLEPPEPE